MILMNKYEQRGFIFPLKPENKPQSLPSPILSPASKLKFSSLFTKQVKKKSDIDQLTLHKHPSYQLKTVKKKLSLPDILQKDQSIKPSLMSHPSPLEECQSRYKFMHNVLDDREARVHLKKFMDGHKWGHWLDFVLKIENLSPDDRYYKTETESLFSRYLDKSLKAPIPLHESIVNKVSIQLDNRKDTREGLDLENLKACQRETKDLILARIFEGSPSFVDSQEFKELIEEKMKKKAPPRWFF